VEHKVKIPKIPITLKTKKIKKKLKAVGKEFSKNGASNISLSSVNKTPTHALQKTLISYSAMKQNGRRNDKMLYFKSSLFPIYHTTIT
jgi:CO dehydrogenase/acetyl-CoA synthase gamma subunit (corrinoid Fe-S protein)